MLLPGDYATFAFDAMLTWAFGLRQYLDEGHKPELISVKKGSSRWDKQP